jgi:hypothetical protein
LGDAETASQTAPERAKERSSVMTRLSAVISGLAFIALTSLTPAHAGAKKTVSSNWDFCPILSNMVDPVVQMRDLGATEGTTMATIRDLALRQPSSTVSMPHLIALNQAIVQVVYEHPQMKTAQLRQHVETACRKSLPR